MPQLLRTSLMTVWTTQSIFWRLPKRGMKAALQPAPEFIGLAKSPVTLTFEDFSPWISPFCTDFVAFLACAHS
jgi:hypothetical protein